MLRRFSLLLIISVCCLLFTVFCILSSAIADEASYFYDDSGRLVRVLKGTEGLIYQYDEVGNLLSISKGTISANPPVLSSINPDILFIGSTTPVIIKGQNLFTTKSVTSGNTSLSIKTLNVTDTEIKAEITVSSDASPGNVNITVTTSYGSASIGATLTSSKLTFSPGQLALTPGNSGSITASISPSIGKDLTIMLNNSDSSIVSVPQSVIIPSTGTATFTVNALKEGVATIRSGNPNTVVFVTKPFAGEDVIIKAGPVSVSIDAAGNSTIPSLPVSAYIDTPLKDSSVVSLLVSALISKDITDAATVSLPVSVYMESSQSNTSTASLPVSVYMESSQSNTSTASLPVSVYMESSQSNTSTASLPVSAYIESSTGNAIVVSPLVSTKISPP